MSRPEPPLPDPGSRAPADADPMVRLGRAYEVWESWSASAEGTSVESLLEANEDLRDLLEPILAEEFEHDVESERDGEFGYVDAVGDEARGREQSFPAGDDTLPAGAAVGPYVVDELLGTGGMGEVYAARQSKPVERRVALKVLRRVMHTRHIAARFDVEQRAVARLSHPNVAQLFDAGVASDGRPFFVMELVEGCTMADYCDSERLTVRQRVALFLDFLDGLQHAHERGIIHRDIKPSNVLVARLGDRAVPKIIDFGIARAVDDAVSGAVAQTVARTRVGQIVGTPESMSPEQAEGDPDLDVRTDVYSSGVLLYELLTGSLPIELEGSVSRMLRAITHDDPPRPSTRVARGGGASEIAQFRRTSTATLRRQLGGELDWITLKSLEKDRTRRYRSAAEFADDLRSYLRREPVSAAPPSMTYALSRFVVRHRVPVAAIAFAFVALTSGLIASTVMYLQAAAARDDEARRGRETLAVTGFLVDLFEQVDPDRSLGTETPVGVFLDEAALRIEHELAADAAVRGRLLRTIGAVYESLGGYDSAEGFYRGALNAYETIQSDEDEPWTSRILLDLASLEFHRGRPDRAVAIYEKAIEGLDRVAGAFPADRQRAQVGLGLALAQRGDLELGEAMLSGVLAPESPIVFDAADVHVAWADVLFRRGDLDAATAQLRLALERLRTTKPAGSRAEIDLLLRFSHVSRHNGDLEAAGDLSHEALELAGRILPAEHPRLATVRVNHANTLRLAARFAEAEAELSAAMATLEATLPPTHRSIAIACNDLGLLHKERGRSRMAIAPLERSVSIYEGFAGADRLLGHAIARANLANVLQDVGRLEEALEVAQRAVSIARAHGGEAGGLVAALSSRAGVLGLLGRQEDAARDLREALEALEERAPHSLQRPWLLMQLALTRCLRGLGEQAEESARAALDSLQDLPDIWWSAAVQGVLGWSLLLQGEREQGLELHRRAVECFRRTGYPGGALTAYTFERYGIQLYRDDPATAAGLFAESAVVRERALGDAHPLVAQSLENEGAARFAAGEGEAARAPLERAVSIRRVMVEKAASNNAQARAKLAGVLLFSARVLTETGAHEGAVAAAREAVGIESELYADDAPRTWAGRKILGIALGRASECEEAASLLRGVLAEQDAASLPDTDAGLRVTLDALAEVLRAKGGEADELEAVEARMR